MKTVNRHNGSLAFVVTLAISVLSSGSALATDDGARAYWKGREGTQGVSIQHLSLDLQASDSQQFAPGQYVYPNADVEANLVIANYARHLVLFDRQSALLFGVASGSVDVAAKANSPISPTPGVAYSESASGYADPFVQLDVNLFGTPPLKRNFDLLDYEPTWTIDVAAMLAVPVGEYDADKLVNLGQNRWFGRVALPIKYHFGVFAPGYMSSFEITPSVWIFAENDDFLGQSLENDPLLQVEAHLTTDFTPSFWGSLDFLYRSGFQSEINGVEMGDELDIGDLGYTFNFQVNDNLGIRAGFSSNVFGDSDLDNSTIRLQLVYGWHNDNENIKKLMGH
ncbi:MAG: transporter [Pseudomonadales bacterium]|nr:transporter [Pseudomonadales bacterium]